VSRLLHGGDAGGVRVDTNPPGPRLSAPIEIPVWAAKRASSSGGSVENRPGRRRRPLGRRKNSRQVADEASDLHDHRGRSIPPHRPGTVNRITSHAAMPGGNRIGRIEAVTAGAPAGRHQRRRLNPDEDPDRRVRSVGNAALGLVAGNGAQARAVDQNVLFRAVCSRPVEFNAVLPSSPDTFEHQRQACVGERSIREDAEGAGDHDDRRGSPSRRYC